MSTWEFTCDQWLKVCITILRPVWGFLWDWDHCKYWNPFDATVRIGWGMHEPISRDTHFDGFIPKNWWHYLQNYQSITKEIHWLVPGRSSYAAGRCGGQPRVWPWDVGFSYPLPIIMLLIIKILCICSNSNACYFQYRQPRQSCPAGRSQWPERLLICYGKATKIQRNSCAVFLVIHFSRKSWRSSFTICRRYCQIIFFPNQFWRIKHDNS